MPSEGDDLMNAPPKRHDSPSRPAPLPEKKSKGTSQSPPREHIPTAARVKHKVAKTSGHHKSSRGAQDNSARRRPDAAAHPKETMNHADGRTLRGPTASSRADLGASANSGDSRPRRQSPPGAKTDKHLSRRFHRSPLDESTPSILRRSPGSPAAASPNPHAAIEHSRRFSPAAADLSSPVGGHTSLPPNPRVPVVPKHRTSSPQRYRGFAGLPPTTDDPPLILFVSRPQGNDSSPTRPRLASPSLSPQGGAPVRKPGTAEASPAPYSPPRSSPEAYYAERRPGAGLCMQLWVMSSVFVATFTLPIGLLLLSYYATPGGTLATAGATSILWNYVLLTPPPAPGSPIGAPPAACFGNVQIADPKSVANTSTPPFSNTSTLDKTFCIYNNSRILLLGGQAFLPRHIPLTYCKNLVYWSLRIRRGNVLLRAPNFDAKHGLGTLRDSTTAAGNPDAIILAAVGGYREDSPEFSFLGRDPASMWRFVSSARELVSDYRLDGIAIHWVAPERSCSDPGDRATFEAVVVAVRDHFWLNGLSVTIAVFLPADATEGLDLWKRLSTLVDYAFIETQAIRPTRVFNLEMCRNMSEEASVLLATFAAVGSESKLCAGVSLAPWIANRGPVSPLVNLSLGSPSFLARTGRGSLSVLCQNPDICMHYSGARGSTESCIVLEQPRLPGPLYLFANLSSLYSVVARGKGPSWNITEHCVALYDIEHDNYNVSCNVNHVAKNFVSLEHFELAMQTPTGLPNIRHLPPC
ncbi:hypothetical protein HPB48_014546 [Haemaphysalis longicornis]|uniref:GH18 domain-containing protein n=1 Tax=Haemaphysalis longicornis TaxID=44386 RepID=A0A9J6GYR3_HAELO|nr:hypothetical protein HPB48_014546 [Haemaphysalis longicornis]